jgi:hypothetical protein
MSGSGHLDRRLADRPRTPLDTSAVTCNTDQADTNFARHFGLPRVSVYRVTTNRCDEILPELTDFSKYSIAHSWLLKLLLCW